MHHTDKLLEHLLSHRKVSDHAVFHRTNRLDVAWNAPKHLLSFAANGLNDFFTSGTTIVANRDDRGLVKNNALAADVNQSVGGTEVDRHVTGKITTQESKHESPARGKLLHAGRGD